MTDDIFKYIDVERTIAEFGYDPRELKLGSNKKVFAICPSCSNVRQLVFQHARKSKNCYNCSRKTVTMVDHQSDDHCQYIDVEKTIAEFGYDPRGLSLNSRQKVYGFCGGGCELSTVRPFLEARMGRKCYDCKWPNKISPETLSSINIEKTILKFGYDPRKLSEKSSKKVVAICRDCENEKDRSMQAVTASYICTSCFSNKPRLGTISKEDIPFVDIEKTIKILGYDPCTLGRNSSRKVFVLCRDCKTEYKMKMDDAFKRERCKSCSAKFNLFNNPELRKKTSERMKNRVVSLEERQHLSKINKGKKLSQETKDKISKAQKGRKGKPGLKGELSPNFGKPPSPKSSFGRGGIYVNKNGEEIWMRSSWERKFAKWLDDNNKIWEYEPKGFPLILYDEDQPRKAVYNPDFLVDGKIWYEVKGFWDYTGFLKFCHFEHQYPEEKIVLLKKAELLALGIDVRR